MKYVILWEMPHKLWKWEYMRAVKDLPFPLSVLSQIATISKSDSKGFFCYAYLIFNKIQLLKNFSSNA